jgi:hypothetical protein
MLLDWQKNAEGAAHTWGALHLNRPLVGLDNLFYNDKTQAGAAGLSRAAFIDPVETVKDVRILITN